MARYTGSVCRLCRREGCKLFLKGEKCYGAKCPLDLRHTVPGEHGQARQRKMSEYGMQLREKQKAKRTYGVLEGQFHHYFEEADRQKGITVLWITHFMEEAALCDRVIVMSAGKVVTEGTPREVFRHVDDLKKLHLDVPPMAELCQELNAGGMELPEGILTVEEMAKEVANKLCPSNSKA